MSLTSGLISSGFASTTGLGVGATLSSTITGFDADFVGDTVLVTFLGVTATGLVTRTGFSVVVTLTLTFLGFVLISSSNFAILCCSEVEEVLFLDVLLEGEVFALVVVTLVADLRVISVKKRIDSLIIVKI